MKIYEFMNFSLLQDEKNQVLTSKVWMKQVCKFFSLISYFVNSIQDI